ncbi:unnamed protein product, partial [Discosporangium mesarthrocarpum]
TVETLSKGVGAVWSKITAGHPEPLAVDHSISKEERVKALKRKNKLKHLNGWQYESTAEQYQVMSVLKEEEEKVYH